MFNSEMKIEGITIGHYTDEKNGTGTTVMLCKKGATIGASVRGSAPGTRETDLADPKNMVQKAHAVFLTGGSAYGLDCGGGIMRYLEQNKIGFKTQHARVPIVLGAVLYDLGYKSAKIRPTGDDGYTACLNAKPFNEAQGSIGAGTGATCGKMFGKLKQEKTGLGISTVELGNGVYVTAVFAANPFGDIYDYTTGKVIAGLKKPTTLDIVLGFKEKNWKENKGENTTIGVVMTNAKLSKAQANKMADIAHDGIALAVRPCHTMLDGDTVFAMSTSEKKCEINRILSAATVASARAIANSVYSIKGNI
jgi:L-aminopeptidase/D-esterase-like protein